VIDALVLAGGIPSEGQPLYPFTRGQPKALLPVADRPMAQWVLDALASSKHVRRVVVVGLDGGLQYPRELIYLPNHGSMRGRSLSSTAPRTACWSSPPTSRQRAAPRSTG
jgi:dTDP-glucose pyrophosphorylase